MNTYRIIKDKHFALLFLLSSLFFFQKSLASYVRGCLTFWDGHDYLKYISLMEKPFNTFT